MLVGNPHCPRHQMVCPDENVAWNNDSPSIAITQHFSHKLSPYKIQLAQQLKAHNHLLCYSFSVWALEQLEVAKDFIVFSDEALLCLGGYISKQNWRFWGWGNPYVIFERSDYCVSDYLERILERWHHWPIFSLKMLLETPFRSTVNVVWNQISNFCDRKLKT